MSEKVPQILSFEINGGKKLSGTIRTNYSKNGSVGLLCASLLNKGKTTLHGIARIEEVYRVIEILESIGVKISWQDVNTVEILPPSIFEMQNIVSASRKTIGLPFSTITFRHKGSRMIID